MKTVGRLLIITLFVATLVLISPKPNASAAGTVKALRFKKLIDGKGKVINNAIVVIENDLIKNIGGDKSIIPADAQIIDLSRYTAIPGMIDVHTHMTYYWDGAPGSKPWAQSGSRMTAVTVFLAQENARKTLETGVTTVRDLGSSGYGDIAMRDLINRGAMIGPRMFVAGFGLQLSRMPANPNVPPTGGRARGVDEVKAAVKRQVDAGADVIKMYGSTGSADNVTGNQTFSFEEIKAAVDAAHAAGKRIAVHSYGPDGARDAVRAGADSVEHATDMDDQTIADMVQRKTFYVPTIDHNRYYVEYKDQFGYGEDAVKGLNDYIQRNLETARRAYKAGVRFAMGSDAVFNMFGQNTRELAWLVKAGMTPTEALTAATTNGAVLLGIEDKIGAVAPGYYADIVAVEGDPITDVNVVINNVRWVMKGGAVVVDKTKPGR